MALENFQEPSCQGVEIRVHGIGDHTTFSALGQPEYKDLLESRVRIGKVPSLPSHKLRLINWSRANRKITRTLFWYLAFPFTLLNLAGYMEPTPTQRRFPAMRFGVACASICMTLAMAAWLTAIIETAWHAIDTTQDRLTWFILCMLGPMILIAFILHRAFFGQAAVDRGSTAVSIATIACLSVGIVLLTFKPASTTRVTADWWPFDVLNTFDPMTPIVIVTTGVVTLIALILSTAACLSNKHKAPYAGAAILLIFAIVILHAGGSILRLATQTIFQAAPLRQEQEASRSIAYTLLPKPDDYDGAALRIDLVPLFLVVFLAIFAVCLYISYSRLKTQQQKPPTQTASQPPMSVIGTNGKQYKPMATSHRLVSNLPIILPRASFLAICVVVPAWSSMILLFHFLGGRWIGWVVTLLQISAVVAVVMILGRRPEQAARQLRRIFGSLADIAGFWSPDLHPLAGASYRRAVLRGIREAINDFIQVYPSDPIALVGHSQGSVVCAWFMRGGHWFEKRTEGRTDRQAIRCGLHDVKRLPSSRITLFTCGSPLASLYATFFPGYFGSEFFRTTEEMSHGWMNYWRLTDPIATRLHGATNRDCTEDNSEPTLGHSEYWRETSLRSDVSMSLARFVKPPSMSLWFRNGRELVVYRFAHRRSYPASSVESRL
ncbi:hypothetical protein [Mycobacterium sp. IS-1496]|uniref:hypothetical protein n=1 Tax=Mycobacterium sp. IS-1496 TaxID=1772284 RepID=UPI000B274349|nr:hypothetical protein [Mycobacterium sp. IS-1496]